MRRAFAWALFSGLVGCTTIAGLDGDYEVGDTTPTGGPGGNGATQSGGGPTTSGGGVASGAGSEACCSHRVKPLDTLDTRRTVGGQLPDRAPHNHSTPTVRMGILDRTDDAAVVVSGTDL